MMTSRGHDPLGPPRVGLWQMVFTCSIFLIAPASGFNLDPESAILFTDPTIGQGRGSYFGFSVALQKNEQDNSAWLIVGAPRSNSSNYSPNLIREPGVIYKCDLRRLDACKELFIDKEGNNWNLKGYHDFKNGGWLGASLDSQPTRKNGRQVTGVCAPRWKSQYYLETYKMQGACYWLNASLSDAPAHKKLPLLNHGRQIFSVYERSFYYYANGEAGMSIHFPDDHTEMIIGAPGIFNWQGSVIHMKDNPSTNLFSFNTRPQRARKDEKFMFSTELVPHPYYTNAIMDFDLNGYAITSGRFLSKEELLYVSGAPRGASMYGKVIMYRSPSGMSQSLNILAEWKGNQLGENFGASLVSADINGDGLSDLVVGSPTFSEANKPDMGRMQVFISTQSGRIAKVSSHSGSGKAMARFSTTLGSLGNINQDLYDDIAVGAPWEDDGKGAVYVYLGSKFGLRKDFAQRLTPEDIPTAINLRGFGISLSRGIDIDNNHYPDLAIGSFLSGHAIFLKARAVAFIDGYITSIPSALDFTDTSFKIYACIKYEGQYVPEQVNVIGTITLDYGHPSPRASFAKSGRTEKNYTVGIVKRETECRSSDVKLKGNKIDVRRPILVNFEWKIQEITGQLQTQPKTDPAASRNYTLPIRIKTDCEDDGDQICSIDLHVEAHFKIYQKDLPFIIGSDNMPVLEISVQNFGESVFLPNVTVEVPTPFALFMPTSHSCDFIFEESRSELVCQLTNPMQKDVEDIVQVIIDTSKVTDASKQLKVKVAVAGEGTEILPSDNILAQEMKLLAKAELELRGYSRSEHIMYQRLDEDTINTTIAKSSFTHYYTLAKSGPTPLESVMFELDIPVNFTDDVNFITLYTPQTNFLNQPFLCTIQGATFAVDKSRNGGNENALSPDMEIPNTTRDNNNTIKASPDVSDDEHTINQQPGIAGWDASSDLSHDQIQQLTCPTNLVACAKIQCQIDSWPGDTQLAIFSIKLEVNFKILAGYISAQAGAIVSSTATASMISLSQDVAFQGKKNTTKTIGTLLLPLKVPGRSLPWWVILLVVLAGLLILLLLCYGLYRAGFFKRKEQEKLKTQRAQVESHTNYGTEGN